MSPPAKLRAFYSYAHADRERWLRTVQTHLDQPKTWGWISDWSDQELLPGDDWNEKLQEQLIGSDVIVMLVTANFLAARGCKEEVALALQLAKGPKPPLICPILASDCLYSTSPIGHLHPAPDWNTPVGSPERHDLLARTARKFVQDLQAHWPDLQIPNARQAGERPLVPWSEQIPELLPHVANRGPQRKAVRESLREYRKRDLRRTILLAFSGPENESHEGFRLCLAKSLIARELGVNPGSVQPERLDWHKDYTGRDDLRDSLTETAERLDKEGVVALLTTVINYSTWPGGTAFGEFLDFWNSWSPRRAQAFVVAQFFQYRLWPRWQELAMWRAFRPRRVARRKSLHTAVLPAFKPVSKLPAQDWAQEVFNVGLCLEGDITVLRTEIGKWYHHESHVIPMQDLSNRFRTLLTTLRPTTAQEPAETLA
jgi:hypothetical protein